MSKLKGSPNIVSYEDYAVIEHNVSVGWDILIRMELLTDLPSYIRDNALSANDVIKLGIDLCSALEVCGTHKIIHRDIKPDNIFLSASGEYKLGDFGVARTIEKTVSGLSKKGTYTYMAPEVYKGEDYGATVDIYSLGIVMYKLLNFNREPFLPPHPQPIKYSDKNSALVRRIGGERIPAPANADEALSNIVLRACAHKASDRYPSASEMKRELVALLNKANAEQPAILQTDQVVSSKTNSDTTPPMIRTQNSEAAEETSESERTLAVTPQCLPEEAPAAEPPVQQKSSPQVYVFGDQSQQPRTPQPSVQQPPRTPQPTLVDPRRDGAADGAKENNRWVTGNVLGWVGFGLTFVLMFILAPRTIIQTIGILVTQILFTVKVKSKAVAIIMMVCSILSAAVLNFVVSIIYLKLLNRKECRK